MKTLIHDGLIVPATAGQPRLESGSILIEDDRIAAIGQSREFESLTSQAGIDVVDARESIVLPGLINAHMHSNESFEQGAYDNLPLELWLARCYPPSGVPAYGAREHYLRTMVCAIESIRSGVTTIQDDVINSYAKADFVDAAVEGAANAYQDSGLRSIITVSFIDTNFIDGRPFMREILPESELRSIERQPPPDYREQLQQFRDLYETWNGRNGRTSIILGPMSPQRISDDFFEEINTVSEDLNVAVHCHVDETRAQAVTARVFWGSSMVEHLHDIGALSPRLTINHGIWLTDGDIELLADNGCSVTHNPLSNMKLGSGVCPVRKLLAAGVNVAIGTDGTSTSDTADMFEAIRAASLLHKLGTHRHEEWISADEVFRMVLAGGARSTLLQDQIGSIEVGKKADIILVDRHAWGLIPLHDPFSQLAYSVNSGVVHTSIIDGRIVMRDRVLTMIDEDELRARIREEAERFRTDYWPAMQRSAETIIPYIEEMLRRCREYELEHAARPTGR